MVEVTNANDSVNQCGLQVIKIQKIIKALIAKKFIKVLTNKLTKY